MRLAKAGRSSWGQRGILKIAWDLEVIECRQWIWHVTCRARSYYSKSEFDVITEDQIAAPYKLQFPEGWLAQSLNGKPLPNLGEPCHSVAAFADPQFW